MKIGDLACLKYVYNGFETGDLVLILYVRARIHDKVYRCILQKTGERVWFYDHQLEKIP